MNVSDVKHIVITGGAGFVGSTLAIGLKKSLADIEITVMDNLKRRGSELNLGRLKSHGIAFCHGDVRYAQDFDALPPFQLMIDCSAEPSVQVGVKDSPGSIIDNNFISTLNCAEVARQNRAAFLLISTSRVYPINRLKQLPMVELETRLDWDGAGDLDVSNGISEAFPLDGARSMYGMTKLASEQLLVEYHYLHDMPVLINRSGVIAGPWQMGKTDQGFMTLWMARHYFNLPLAYFGFGGTGKQVRDVLHVDDLLSLVNLQIDALSEWQGQTYNIGGGREISTSLLELTEICREITGNDVEMGRRPETNPVDIPIYLSDYRLASETFNWQPKRNIKEICLDIHSWLQSHESLLMPIFKS